MKIKILGTRGKIKPSAPSHENHTGILIDDRLLIDFGEPQYMEFDPEAIVFTHFHPDHAFFVPEQEIFQPKISLFGPEEHELIPKLNVINESFEWEEYTFTPFPVIHALRLKSLGYIIQKGEKKLMITGDVAWIEKKNLEELPEVDMVITEASYINKGGRINRKGDAIFGHTGIPDLLRLLSPLSQKIAFLHYGSWFFTDIEKNKEKIRDLEPSLEIIPTHDGMELEI